MPPCRRSRHGAGRRSEDDRRSAVPRDGALSEAAGDRTVPRRAGAGTVPGPAAKPGVRIDGISSKELFERIRDLSLGLARARRGRRRSRRDHRRRAGPNGSCATWRSWPPAPSPCRSIRRSPRRRPATSSRTPARASRSCRRARSSRSCRKSGTCCRRSRRSSSWSPRAGRAPSVMTLDEVAQRGHARMAGEWGAGREFRDDGARGPSRRPGDHHLHVGDDRRAQGRDAHAREPGREPARGGRRCSTSPRTTSRCRSCRSATASSGWSRSSICSTGVTIIFAESFDTLGRDIARVRPTVLTGVPRVYEKMQARILEKGQAGSAVEGRGLPLGRQRRAGAGQRGAPRRIGRAPDRR